jgi:molybdopterin-guanine dinucleotide biosynthesis protein A
MGTNKSLIEYKGSPLIAHIHRALSPLFEETIVSTNDTLPVPLENVRLIEDQPPGYGPIGGIVSCLEQAKNHRVFISACDIPSIYYDLIAKLMRESKRHAIAVPRDSEGYLEPLHAVYNKSIVPMVRTMMKNDERRIRMVYDHVDTAYVPLMSHQKLVNINTPSEYRRLT